MKPLVLAIVIPCYNEAAAIPIAVRALLPVLRKLQEETLLAQTSFILFVDDGSKDETWSLIEQAGAHHSPIYGVKLTRNVGQQAALLAGYRIAARYSDAIISMDVDLQDDPMTIREMILKYIEGYDIVFGVRQSRKADTWFKRYSSFIFYKIMNLLGTPIVHDHAHYRLLSRRAARALLQFREKNLFLQGIIPLLGFRQTKVWYVRNERSTGESKYSLKKLLENALEAVTSFSIFPIRLISMLGLLILSISFVSFIYSLVSKIMGLASSGWTSLMLSVWMIGGLLTFSMGLIGEYIGKIYLETKNRPLFIVEKSILPKTQYPHKKINIRSIKRGG